MIAWTVALTFPAGFLLSDDWPKWRGPNSDGISPEKGINKDWRNKPPKELWRVEMHDGGHAGPSVADGKVFIVDHKGSDDIVLAIDIQTGKEAWRFTYADRDKENYGFTRATPLIDSGKVYTVSMMGNVHCLDAKTGRTIWQRNTREDFRGKLPGWFLSMSPVTDGDKLILCPGGPDASVVAIKKDTGETIWQGGGSDVPGYATPVITTLAGKKQYLVLTSKNLISVNPETGRLLWSFPWDAINGTNVSTPVVIGGDKVFITSLHARGGALVGVTAGGAKVVWENKNINALIGSPVYHDGYIYGNRSPDSLVCLDAGTGRVVWEQKGFEHGGFVGVDGTIIAMKGKTGSLVMMEMSPKAYKELGSIEPFPECRQRAWAPPVVADGKLVVRDMKALVCLDLK